MSIGARLPRGRTPGLSLLELLVGLALATVLAGAARLVWGRLEGAFRLEAALRQVAADIAASRTLARASASRVRLVFQPASGRYERERAPDGAYELEATRLLPAGIVVASVNSGGDLTFWPRGHSENATLVLADRHGRARALRLNQRGRVTLAPAP